MAKGSNEASKYDADIVAKETPQEELQGNHGYSHRAAPVSEVEQNSAQIAIETISDGPAELTTSSMQVAASDSRNCFQSYRAKKWLFTRKAVGAVRKDFKRDGQGVASWLEGHSSEERCDLALKVASAGSVTVCPSEIEGSLELRPEHLELECKDGTLSWLPVLNGYLACSGAPGEKPPKTPKDWHLEGATVVVNLLKADEDTKRRTKARCEDRCLRVEHVPLTGRRAAYAPRGQLDLDSWRRLRKLMPELLQAGEHVVVHCAAGMHRTGSVVYLAFRLAGFEPLVALAAVEQIRAETHGALMEPLGRSDSRQLWEAVEAVIETDATLVELEGGEEQDCD